MLILSGWASLHLGEVSIAEERFASVRRVVRSSRAQAEGIDASNNFRRGLDWEESSDFLRNLSDLSRMMTVMDFKRDNDIEQDRLSLVKLCLKSSFCKSLVDRHLRYVEDQTGEIRRRLISELKKTLKEKGLLSEEMEKKIREIEESFNR